MSRYLLIFLFISHFAWAQEPQTEIAVCSYEFFVENKLKSSIMESDYEYNEKLHKANQESLALIKSAYDYVTDLITRKTKIDFLPISEISPYLDLNSTGYPTATLRQASKVSDFTHYACLDISIEGNDTEKNHVTRPLPDGFNSGVYEHLYITTFPSVRVDLMIGDKHGKKLKSYSGVYQMSDSIIVETKNISSRDHNGNFRNDQFFNPEKIAFMAMLDSAVVDMMGKMEEFRYY